MNDAKIEYRIYYDGFSDQRYNEWLTTMTDKNGIFEFDFEFNDKEKRIYYTIEVRAINQSGEVQEAKSNYNFSEFPHRLTIQNPSFSDVKDFTEIELKSTNLNNAFLAQKGIINIYKKDEPKGIFASKQLDVFDENMEYEVLSEQQKADYFSKYRYQKTNENNVKLIETIPFDTADTTRYSIRNKYTRGEYIIEAFSIIHQDTVKVEKNVKLYEDTSFRTHQKEFLIMSFSKATYKINDTFEAIFETDFEEDGTLFIFEQHENKMVQLHQLKFENQKAIFRYAITAETLKNNPEFLYFFIRNNQIESSTFNIQFEDDNNNLLIKTEVFRDKITPGQLEKWTLKIENPNAKNSQAEVLATMYDSSLDQFNRHSFYQKIGWDYWRELPIDLYQLKSSFYTDNNSYALFKPKDFNFLTYQFPNFRTRIMNIYLSELNSQQITIQSFRLGANVAIVNETDLDFDDLEGEVSGINLEVVTTALGSTNNVTIRGVGTINNNSPALYIIDGIPSDQIPNADEIQEITVLKGAQATSLYGSRAANGAIIITSKNKKSAEADFDLSNVKIRENLTETAFFYPTLYTDSNGNVSFEFNSPEALTEWKMLVFAHDKKLNSGDGVFITKTQKDLMVSPHLPRFFREKDQIEIRTQIQNLSKALLNGQIEIDLIDPKTNLSVREKFNIQNVQQNFDVDASQTILVKWKMTIPENLDAVIVKIVAGNEQFSDGEQKLIPILSSKILIKDVEPIVVLAGETNTYKIDKTKQNIAKLSIEMNVNPMMTLISTLDDLAQYPYDCIEQQMSKWFAMHLIQHIKKQHPTIAAYFKNKSFTELKNELNNPISNLENPWKKMLRTDDEKLQQIAQWFESNQIESQLKKYESKIFNAQQEDGGFPWFDGGKSNDFITQKVILYYRRALKLNTVEVNKNWKKTIEIAMNYLQKNAIDRTASKPNQKLNAAVIDYFYLHQNLALTITNQDQKLLNYYKNELNQLDVFAAKQNINTRTKTAMVAKYLGKEKQASTIISSLQQEMIKNKRDGEYWNNFSVSNFPTAMFTQSLLVEAYDKFGLDTQFLKQYMYNFLHQNRTFNTISQQSLLFTLFEYDKDLDQKFESPKLLNLALSKFDERLGQYTFTTSQLNEFPDEFTISNSNKNHLYGAIKTYAYEDLDKVKASHQKLKIEKEILIEENGKWIPLKRNLKLGEKAKIILKVSSTENLEFVHIKDQRASGLEPYYQPSQYVWFNIPHYRETKDASTNFFLDRLPEGQHIFEYEVKAANVGIFSDGIATIECMYNANYNSRTNSKLIEINDDLTQ